MSNAVRSSVTATSHPQTAVLCAHVMLPKAAEQQALESSSQWAVLQELPHQQGSKCSLTVAFKMINKVRMQNGLPQHCRSMLTHKVLLCSPCKASVRDTSTRRWDVQSIV